MRVAVVGAGLAGSTLAALLSERGHDVDVYELRADPRTTPSEDRSINLGISARGIRTLRRIGLWDALGPSLVPMRGRAIHRPDGRSIFTPYGTDPSEILYSVRRSELNGRLIERAGTARFHFGMRCTGLSGGVLSLTDTATGRTCEQRPDLVIGADGAFSAVRRFMQHGTPADYRQEFLEWGYKELTIPPGAPIPLEALNIWPSAHGLIVAHPNADGSHTGTLFLPHDGRPSFASLDSAQAVQAFFRENFPQVPELIPDLLDQFGRRPVAHLVTVRTSPWYSGDGTVLVGDAAHAVYPFYGQGMNSSLEDCLILDDCLERHGATRAGRAAALAEFQQKRKPHTDVLAELSARNFVELRDGTRSPLRLARNRADRALARLFPRTWLPLYTMVSHTTIPYAEALQRARRQDRALGIAAGTVTAAVGIGAVATVCLRR
ncbi:MAG TPA: NAD(P)/FAD-dependent oxidoreductase [Pseudonocardia sp.]|nr:NAD(P)/FAD-dependent oxidoreductase [Pseudonocardia sp.]